MAKLSPYQKPQQSAVELCNKLLNQGLLINDLKVAENILNRCSYYRFKAYLYPFQDNKTKVFTPGTSFEDCYQLYIFDSELRHYIFKIIEQVEIGVRSLFDQWMTKQKDNPFWYLDSSLFSEKGEQVKTVSRLRDMFKNSKEDYAVHYKSKHYNEYCSFFRDLPPGWVAIELMTFGDLTKLMSSLADEHYNSLKINRFAKSKLTVEKYKSLCSWLITIQQVRNRCAHHNRLFNSNFASPTGVKRILSKEIPLVKTKAPQGKHEEDQLNRLYTAIIAIQKLNSGIGYSKKMGPKLAQIIESHPISSRFMASMGFPKEWKKEPLLFDL